MTSPVLILGGRKGYHGSHVVTPYIEALTTIESRAALKRFARYQPEEPIRWRKSGRRLFWVTEKRASVEDEIMKMARRRERGIRMPIAELARWLGAKPDLVNKTLRGLAARGIAVLEVGRGRYAKAVFRLVGVNHAANKYKAASLTGAFVPKGTMIDGNRPIARIERDADGIHDREMVDWLTATLEARR